LPLLDEIAYSLEKKRSQTLSLSSLTLKNTSRDESAITKAVTLFLSLSLFFFFFVFLCSSLRRQRSTKRVTKTFFRPFLSFF